MRIIACIEYPEVLEKILVHLNAKASKPNRPRRRPYGALSHCHGALRPASRTRIAARGAFVLIR